MNNSNFYRNYPNHNSDYLYTDYENIKSNYERNNFLSPKTNEKINKKNNFLDNNNNYNRLLDKNKKVYRSCLNINENNNENIFPNMQEIQISNEINNYYIQDKLKDNYSTLNFTNTNINKNFNNFNLINIPKNSLKYNYRMTNYLNTLNNDLKYKTKNTMKSGNCNNYNYNYNFNYYYTQNNADNSNFRNNNSKNSIINPDYNYNLKKRNLDNNNNKKNQLKTNNRNSNNYSYSNNKSKDTHHGKTKSDAFENSFCCSKLNKEKVINNFKIQTPNRSNSFTRKYEFNKNQSNFNNYKNLIKNNKKKQKDDDSLELSDIANDIVKAFFEDNENGEIDNKFKGPVNMSEVIKLNNTLSTKKSSSNASLIPIKYKKPLIGKMHKVKIKNPYMPHSTNSSTEKNVQKISKEKPKIQQNYLNNSNNSNNLNKDINKTNINKEINYINYFNNESKSEYITNKYKNGLCFNNIKLKNSPSRNKSTNEIRLKEILSFNKDRESIRSFEDKEVKKEDIKKTYQEKKRIKIIEERNKIIYFKKGDYINKYKLYRNKKFFDFTNKKDMNEYYNLLKSKKKLLPVIKNCIRKDIKLNPSYISVETLQENEILPEFYNTFEDEDIKSLEKSLEKSIDKIFRSYIY